MSTATGNRGMPVLIPAAGFEKKFGSVISGRNGDDTRYFLAKGVRDFALNGLSLPSGYRLVCSLKEDQYRLIADSKGAETVYAVKRVLMKNILPLRETCTQILVWRSVLPQHESVVSGIAKRFFRFFLSRYAIVVTDSEHTGDGKRFWEVMIAWALAEPGCYVYLSDGSRADRPLERIHSLDAFYQHWSGYAWGSDRDVHSHRLFVISREAL